MVTIDVDFEVFKVLTARRCSEEMTENDVLREAFGLSKTARNSIPVQATPASGASLGSQRASPSPHGTEFRATYKGQRYIGVVRDGALVVNGKRFSSPSAAAISITGNPVNGWRFWECLVPGTTKWKLAADFR